MHERVEMAIGGSTLLRRHRGHIFFWTISPYAIGPLSVLFVCNVGILWPKVGWFKIPLGTEVGLGPGHIVLEGDPALPPRKAHSTPTRVARWCNG